MPGLNDLTRHELFDLLELAHDSLAVSTDEELQNLLLRIQAFVPCTNIVSVLGGMTPSLETQEFVKVINVSYPTQWVALYMEEGYVAVDPILRSHFRYFSTQIWSETFRQVTSKREQAFVAHAKLFGMSEGITVGVACQRNRVGSLFSFSGPSMNEHHRHAVLLEYLSPHLHVALMRAAFSTCTETLDLSCREQEVLKWMKEGKTNWEISHIIHVSEQTVKFHVKNILAKLQASTRGHAVAIAMERRLVGF